MSTTGRVRVLWVVKGLGPGGAERLLAAAARAHDHERFEIECAYVLPWKDHLVGELESAGVRTHCLSRRRSDPRWPMRLWSLVRDGGFDVVHVHSPLPGSVARAAARTMPADVRPGIVSTEHNRWETHRPPTRLANRLTGRWDDAALAVTDEVRSSMAGPVASRATTVRHGIDVAATATAVEHRAEIRAELGLAPDELAIGTVANFRPQKDYPNLLRAARLLADRDVPVRVVAVGQGPQEAEVRALRDELGLSDRVILTGFRDDAVRVMGACDAFVLASQWEGLPVAIMEALALGLPIVATDVGGMAEELTHDVDALLVPPRDSDALAAAIERLATDDDLRTRFAAASRAKAAEFDVPRTVELIEQTYTRVARTGPESTQSRQKPPTAALSDTESPGATPNRPRIDTESPGATPNRPRIDTESPGAAGSGAERHRVTQRSAGSGAGASGGAGLEIRAATVDDRDAILEVLRRSLGGDDDPRYPELFAWKHDENSLGSSPMWVATDGDRIAGFRTFLRWEFERGGHVLRAVRAVDTATDPDYQGRGLFTALTRHALAEVAAEGVDFVFNTPNDQSRPGYLKMGWREVGRLPTAVRFTGPTAAKKALRSKVPADRWSEELTIGRPVREWIDSGDATTALASRTIPADVRTIRTRIDEPFLRWRFATPLLGYRVIEHHGTTVIVRARRRGSALELVVVATFGNPAATDRLAASAAKEAGADYVIRLGSPSPLTGYLPLPGGGPILTWRAVNDHGFPPLPNWNLTLGDIELF